MNLKGIVSVSGMGGLYKVVAPAKNGFIVEALSDKKRAIISSSSKVSSLEEISVFTTKENVPLPDVLEKIKQSEGNPPDPKEDGKVIRDYFKSILPEYSEEKVYESDIRKLISWYLLLKDTPDYWVKKEEIGEAESAEDKNIALAQKTHEKHHAQVKDTGKISTHGKSAARTVIPQKRGSA